MMGYYSITRIILLAHAVVGSYDGHHVCIRPLGKRRLGGSPRSTGFGLARGEGRNSCVIDELGGIARVGLLVVVVVVLGVS